MKRTAPVNRIIPLSTVDGPGCRTAIFLQGCNIACAYCHNPETQNLCRGCGACVPGCPSKALSLEGGAVSWNEAACTGCDACLAACQHNASPRVREMTAGEVMARVRENVPFVRGITVSGGECTLYPEFLEELFTLARAEGLTCLIDSNGMVDFEPLTGLMAVCDGVMLDVKSWDNGMYRALTGADNATVKRNLAFLAQRGRLEELRVVCVDGHVDAPAVIEGAARLLGEQARSIRLKLIAFRANGVRGAFAGLASPSGEMMRGLERLARAVGFRDVTVT